MRCHSCNGEIKIEDFVYRADECPHCNADMHCCLNCTHYDPSAHNRCREPQAEWVSDRERANRCEYFALGGGSRDSASAERAHARANLDDLFKKS